MTENRVAKVCKVNGGNTPLFLNLGNKWRSVVSFKLKLHYSNYKEEFPVPSG
jgi:hypothetical protein